MAGRAKARLLRSGQIGSADVAIGAEELETLGRSEARAPKAGYRLIATHFLEAMYKTNGDTKSWESTIIEQHFVPVDLTEDNSGLKPMRASTFAVTYVAARKQTVAETGLPLSTFPDIPMFGVDQVEDHAWSSTSLPAIEGLESRSTAPRISGCGVGE